MASKRRLRRKQEKLKKSMCGDKQGYANQTQAVSHVIRLSKRDRDLMGTYPCDFCNKWHVGHKKFKWSR